MPSGTVCKTIHQYNKEPIAKDDMKKLLEIAGDYAKVKEYVYGRYSGIGSLSKIYPGYTVQNEMIATGLREELGLPFVYFNLAVFDALGDIKAQWTRTREAVAQKVGSNGQFSDEEKHYLRYLLKVNNAFGAVLNCQPVNLKAGIQKKYGQLSGSVDVKKLDNYLRRQVRRLHVRMHVNRAEGFSLTERAYRYGDHGIYITMKEKRKRIYVPLTDNNQYSRQIYIKLFPESGKMEIKIPVNVKIQKHTDYTRQVGLAVGMYVMLTTDEGNVYGEKLGEYQIALADWVREQAIKHTQDQGHALGRKKYMAKKHRMTEQLHSYINMELNRFLKTEKPQTVYIPKLPRPRKHGGSKEINNSVALWQRGYIRGRLHQKCREQSVVFVEVFGKGISAECYRCGGNGEKKEGIFVCGSCGYETEEKRNAAQNAKKRGMEGDGRGA
ncbi:hypothetical protein IMSAGC019_00434 [Lachnospiraceae bacterium]|nr:hypothetical protein IMSAGC019_00434 [Lachnospiraceae bacterium]